MPSWAMSDSSQSWRFVMSQNSTAPFGSNPGFADTDYPMFRLADAYLIYAEAALGGGGGSRAQALTYVNALRTRAYGNASGNITDAQLTLDFLLDERGRELLWEGQRRTDLIRFGKFTGPSYLWSWKGGTKAGSATDFRTSICAAWCESTCGRSLRTISRASGLRMSA